MTASRVEKKSGDTMKSFLSSFALLIAGFMFTGVIGNSITNRYQEKSARLALQLTFNQNNIQNSMIYFQQISTLVDRRLFLMRQLQTYYQKPDKNTDYNKLVGDYNQVWLCINCILAATWLQT